MIQLNDRTHRKSHSRRPHTRNLLATALALALATAGGSPQAATQLVTNCNDHGSGSLRAAITAAMSDDVVDATGLTCSTISLSTGALGVSVKNLTVSGAGRDRLTVTNGAKYGRVFRHEGVGVLTLKGLTITSGVVSPTGTEPGTKGGCIYSKGTVALGNIFVPNDAASSVVVSDCTAISTHAGVAAEGGGIFAWNGVGLLNSVVTRSRAVAQDQATMAFGGGIATHGSSFTMKYSEVANCSVTGPQALNGGIYAYIGSAKISHSTIADNSAEGNTGGAGLFSNGGSIRIDNTTVSGNSASDGGGLTLNVTESRNFASGEGMTLNVAGSSTGISIASSTITANRTTAEDGFHVSGAALFGGPETLQSTIIAGNSSVHGVTSDLYLNTDVTGANNLLGTTFGAPPPSGFIITTNPKLGPLSNRGGSTRIHLPLANSPAINAGNNNSGSTTDQRGPGFPRVIGSAPDIGAAEYDPDRIFNNGFD